MAPETEGLDASGTAPILTNFSRTVPYFNRSTTMNWLLSKVCIVSQELMKQHPLNDLESAKRSRKTIRVTNVLNLTTETTNLNENELLLPFTSVTCHWMLPRQKCRSIL